MSSFPSFPSLPLGSVAGAAALSPAEEEFLAAVQGNVLQGHGCDHQQFLFFRFTDSPSRSAEFLRVTAASRDDRDEPRWVVSALDQHRQRARRKAADRGAGAVSNASQHPFFASVMLSRAGLEWLGVTPPASDAFRHGMRTRMNSVLVRGEMDAPPYAAPENFHGVCLLAAHECATLDQRAAEFATGAERFGVVILAERERALAWREATSPYGNGYRPTREPFGFADGISQPRFFAEHRIGSPTRADRPSAWRWTDLRLSDVFLTAAGHEGATFATLLKIDQRVATFRRYETEVAALLTTQLGLAPATAAYVAPAILMGRTRQGYPLHEVIDRLTPDEAGLRALFPEAPPTAATPDAAAKSAPEMPAWLNEFDFEPRVAAPDAPPVARCPFHSHLRKMNPRIASSPHGTERSFVSAQPVRRGAAYDPQGRLALAEREGGRNWPDHDVGLLFFAYMASLERQFEQAHTHWAQDPTFVGQDGVDPLLVPTDVAHTPATPSFGSFKLPPMPRVIHRRGGVYLYVPSLPWLHRVGR